MLGYISASVEDLQDAEKERYRSVYCGICKALGRRCGQRCRLTLSYDMTFLALLLSSLYEPLEQAQQGRCVLHPTKRRAFVRSDCIDYAADLSVAFAYHKLEDDWIDDRKTSAKAGMALCATPYKRVRERLPRACEALEAGMARLHAIERANEPSLDAAANCFGVVLGELFAWKSDDYWAHDLRAFGARLGKFIYIMDAAMDYDNDVKSGSYNPFIASGCKVENERAALELLIADSANAFEVLPLERDLHLMRSVLYAGVWRKYDARANGEKSGDTIERGASAHEGGASGEGDAQRDE